jgi:hypothetical protein
MMKVVCPTTNKEGCLVTTHQFYTVPGNKMEKLPF